MSNEADKTVEKTTIDTNSTGEPKVDYIKPGDEIEILKLNLERERFELQKNIENSKLEIEKLKIGREQKFWNRNSGALITATVSLAAVIVSLGQVWSTWISQDKQLQIAALQKGQEIEMINRQKEKELSLLDEQNRREWNLSAAKFITDNRKTIFDGNPQEQKLLAKVIQTIYPPDVAFSLLEKLESASPPDEVSTWREAREKIVRPAGAAKRVIRVKPDQPVDAVNQNKLNDPTPQLPPSNAKGSDNLNGPPVRISGGGCASSTLTTQVIDGKTYTCYLSGEDDDFCYMECYPSQN